MSALPSPDDLKLYAITLHTAENRGDHAADITLAFEPLEGETVERLIRRTLGTMSKYDNPRYARLEIRLMMPHGNAR